MAPVANKSAWPTLTRVRPYLPVSRSMAAVVFSLFRRGRVVVEQDGELALLARVM
jgi:hypothetical protein